MSEDLKRQAAVAAIEEVHSGMAIGLGTGSTIAHFIRELGVRVREGLVVSTIPTSERSAALAREAGVAVRTFADHRILDLTVDGADEVSPELDLIKGLGGALVREKIVACASRRLVIVVDDTKLVKQLGAQAPIPVEVLPFAEEWVIEQLRRIGGDPAPRKTESGDRFISDNGNHILDWRFGPAPNPAGMERTLKLIPGVVDSGIFAGLADRVIVASTSGVRVMDRKSAGVRKGAIV